MRLYLSGPITGTDDYKLRFRRAKMELAAAGYTNVVNPAELDGVLPVEQMTWDEIMTVCIELLAGCDALILMDGWERSIGCNREVGYAQGADLIVVPLDEMLRGVRE